MKKIAIFRFNGFDRHAKRSIFCSSIDAEVVH